MEFSHWYDDLLGTAGVGGLMDGHHEHRAKAPFLQLDFEFFVKRIKAWLNLLNSVGAGVTR